MRSPETASSGADLGEYCRFAEAVPQITWIADRMGRPEYFNARWFEYTGRSEALCLGLGWQQLVHPHDLVRMTEARRRTLESGEDFEVEYRLRRRDGVYRWFLARSVPIRAADASIWKWFGTCTDIHDQKHAEGVLRLFASAGRLFGETLDPVTIAGHVADLLVPEFAEAIDVFIVRDGALERLVSRPSSETTSVVRAEAIERCIAMRQTMRMADGTRLLPLIARGICFGALRIVVRDEARFALEDLQVGNELGHRAAVALDNALRYQREHWVSEELQRAILPPRLPSVPGARLSWAYVPAASELLVGGDWYDAFALDDGRIGLSIGDVTGHGLDAAVVMAEMRQAVRFAAMEGFEPQRVLDHADRMLRSQRPEAIATAGFGIYDPTARTLVYANAGHPSPLLASDDAEVSALDVDGLPLGMRSLGSGAQRGVELASGTLAVFYTDGLTEYGRDALGGEIRLRAAVAAQRQTPGKDSARCIYARVMPEHPEHTDDTALLTLYVE